MRINDFLRARLDDDEAAARSARESFSELALTQDGRRTYGFLRRIDPARILEEVEAKRQMVGWFEAVESADGGRPEEVTAHMTAIGFVALLALPYADHPDYEPEWRP